jgi:peptide/nickel transport system substrate-binding protein
MVTPKRKPFDDARMRRALTLAIDRWHGAPEVAKIANVRTVGGIVFPGWPLAADKEELEDVASKNRARRHDGCCRKLEPMGSASS